MEISRRHAMLAGAALATAALAGCTPSSIVDDAARRTSAGNSPSRGGASSTGTATADPTATATASPTGTPSPSPTATPSPTSTPLARLPFAERKAALERQYGGLRPTKWGMDLPGIRTSTGTSAVLLTFDACGGPRGSAVDHDLLTLLRSHNIPALFFLNKRWIEANLAVAREMARVPFWELGNHGTRHCPLSVTGRAAYKIPGTASVGEVVDEVGVNHDFMIDTLGVTPRFFRAGTAHYDDVALAVCNQLGEVPVGFSVNGDFGATASAQRVLKNVQTVTPGGIIISHMNQPRGETAEGYTRALPWLTSSGIKLANPHELVSLT